MIEASITVTQPGDGITTHAHTQAGRWQATHRDSASGARAEPFGLVNQSNLEKMNTRSSPSMNVLRG